MPASASDEEIISFAAREQRCVITQDLDFSALMALSGRTAPSIITLRLASASLPLKASVTDRTVRIERAELTADVGTASVRGIFDPDEPAERFLERPGTRLDADIDLAKLAGVLPKLLRVRDGTEFREGKLTVKVESKETPNGTTWVGSVNTSALKATRGGKEIHWEEPLAIEFARSGAARGE